MAWYDDYGDAWNARDGARVASFMAEEAVYTDIALGESHKGPDAIKEFVDRMLTEFSSDYVFEFPEPVSLTGDSYALEWILRGTHDGANGPLPATGKPFEIHGVSVGRLEDGKIKENRDYWSLGEFLVQVGILPPMGEAAQQ